MQSKEDWLSVLKRWEASGVGQRAFCEAEGLLYQQFCLKRKEFLQKDLIEDKSHWALRKAENHDFLPIEIKGAASKKRRAPMIEIELPYGIVLRIPTHVAQ
jgi:hypothetical protein